MTARSFLEPGSPQQAWGVQRQWGHRPHVRKQTEKVEGRELSKLRPGSRQLVAILSEGQWLVGVGL